MNYVPPNEHVNVCPQSLKQLLCADSITQTWNIWLDAWPTERGYDEDINSSPSNIICLIYPQQRPGFPLPALSVNMELQTNPAWK